MQELQSPLIATELARLLQTKGGMRLTLDQTIVPVVMVAELEASAPPPVVRHCVAGFAFGGVALQRPTLRFEMIGGNLAKIRRINIAIEAATDASTNRVRFFHAGNAASIVAMATTAGKAYTDGRLLAGSGGAQAPAGVLTFGTQVADLGTIHSEIYIPKSGLQYEPSGWVVGTGRAGALGFLEFQVNTLNVACIGSMEWDEFAIP